MLVGNKSDLKDKREVKKEDAIEFANDNHIGFIETSALEGSNVDIAFDRVISEIYRVISTSQTLEE